MYRSIEPTRHRHWPLVASLAAVVLAAGCGSKRDDGRTTTSGDQAEAGAEHAAVARVTLTPAQAQNAGIAYAVVAARTSAGALEATAQIEPPADRIARIGARVPGRVVEVRAAEGDIVRPGEVLGVLDSPELGQAKADYFAARATATLAAETAGRERQLYERQISAEREWRQAEAEAVRARAQRDAAENRLHALGVSDADLRLLQSEAHYSSTIPLRTPIGGVVVTRAAAQGQPVEPGDTLFTVVDPREVWILIDVYEQTLARVHRGQTVRVRTTAFPDSVFTGRVATIGAAIEPTTRSAKVRVALPNPGGLLKPGMFASVRIEGAIGADSGPQAKSRLFIPTTALQRDGADSVVFVPAGPHAYERRAVRLGYVAADVAEVLDGLTAGDSVVTNGAFLLKSELRKGELGEGDEH